MKASIPFGRFIPAMITPFDANRDLDLDRAQELAERLVNKGSDALIISGTTGESPTVFYPQKVELFNAVIEAVGGRVPVIANVGDNCTADSAEFAQDVVKLGVDGIMTVVPYYNKPPQEGLYQHFSCIARAAGVPMILYNIPGRCVINMEAETTLRLAHDIDNIVAVKEASGRLEQIKQIIDEAPEGFVVYSGDDETTLPVMELGGYGVITTIGNVAPERMKEIVTAMAEGDHERALAAHTRLQPLMKELFITANPIMVKEAMRLVGFDCGGVRLPLIDATPEQRAGLEEVMKAVGVL
ncbi:MAG: 4-hydroxy-tetrahydrodipicolinate synthase [Coriobacteriales bacterium]|jgi:4-hydroxy-tetrahydrodipicolinate synthase|nr:4-hydroxy-tetrahydrodipicolinate synthase [Coriobacteriales bacterium]